MQKDMFSRAQPDTGKWLLNSPEFQFWIKGDLRTLWCPGNRIFPHELITDAIAGVGKTIMRCPQFRICR